MSIGERLKKARKERHMSQEALAEQIGVSRGMITNIEFNRVDSPQLMIVNAICNILDINKEWLLNGIGSMETNSIDQKCTKFEHIDGKKELSYYIERLSDNEQEFLYDVLKSYVEHFK